MTTKQTRLTMFDAIELELELRLLLDAVMRHRQQGFDESGLTADERALIKSWWIRDSEVWSGDADNCQDIVAEALRVHFCRTSERLSKTLGDPAAIEQAIDRLCTRGPGGFYARFAFIDATFIYPVEMEGGGDNCAELGV